MVQTQRALTWAWIALVAVTLLSLAVAESPRIATSLEAVTVVAAATLKGRVILVWFMGVRSFPLAWRAFFLAWLLGNAAVIVIFHLIGHG
jgi:hypothetical protein